MRTPNVAFTVTSARPAGPAPTQAFATSEQARRYAMPKRVRHPTGYPFASGCSPPRLAATQLPSASYAVTTHGKDFHLADKASSRTHSPRPPSRGPGRRRDAALDPGSSLRAVRGDREGAGRGRRDFPRPRCHPGSSLRAVRGDREGAGRGRRNLPRSRCHPGPRAGVQGDGGVLPWTPDRRSAPSGVTEKVRGEGGGTFRAHGVTPAPEPGSRATAGCCPGPRIVAPLRPG